MATRGGPDILMVTEGTYPYVVGGVSSWCDLLVHGLPHVSWRILPIVAGERRRDAQFSLPENVELLRPIALWSEGLPRWRWRGLGRRTPDYSVPATMVRALLGWHGELAPLVEALVWCRRHPDDVPALFKDSEAWRLFLDALQEVLDERVEGVGPAPPLDVPQAVRLYQCLYWLARTAAVATPPADVLHVTAAGWAAVPALVDQALRGTPFLLTEHGVYVREAYLDAARRRRSAADRFISTRLARGLTRAAFAAADVISPVTGSNALWEEGLGVEPEKIRIIYNGVEAGDVPTPLPGTRTVVSVGRIDPLKDVQTMLRVADEVLRHEPEARFLHYGPVSEGQDAYGRACFELHGRLGLGERFRFMGRTSDPTGALRGADVVIMTSISEALPLAILEAMTQARPVVSTGVGGVPDVLHGCGLVAPPGDVAGLASGVTTLLRNPTLAARLGRRGYVTALRKFTRERCLGEYDALLHELAAGGPGRAGAVPIGHFRNASPGATLAAGGCAQGGPPGGTYMDVDGAGSAEIAA